MKEDFGVSYAGPVNITIAGVQCGPWSSTDYYLYGPNSMWPEGNRSLVDDYCKNPSESVFGPFCHHIGSSWNWCDVPSCGKFVTACHAASRKTFKCLAFCKYCITVSPSIVLKNQFIQGKLISSKIAILHVCPELK